MSTAHPHIGTFTRLGGFLGQFAGTGRSDGPTLTPLNDLFFDDFVHLLEKEPGNNPWFTPENLARALEGISRMLDPAVLQRWISRYRFSQPGKKEIRTIGLVLAGNIPLVGFHDLLCVLVSGHRVLARPSSRDDRLITKIGEILAELDPTLGARIRFTQEPIRDIDAVIATGSDQSGRYFDYYFRNIPHIIRRNRNSVAVLTGNESDEELVALGADIFTYFGMGCRNVTKLYVPPDYDLKRFLSVMDRFAHLSGHHKYGNNVDYYRTVYLMNRNPVLDNGALILKEDKGIASPVGVVFYEKYSDAGILEKQLQSLRDQIQCVVSLHPDLPDAIDPGSTQRPMPWDYADGIDVMEFLIELTEKRTESTAH